MKKTEFTVLMPCLNEEKTIGICLGKAKEYMEKHGYSYELLVVDNGSKDQSASIAGEYGARIVQEHKKGYGNALRCGILHARGRYTIMGDCDDSYDFADLSGIIAALHDGYAFVTGNRFNEAMEKGAMSFSHRYIGVPLLSFLGRLKYRVAITDFHCGLRGFDTETAKGLHLKCGGMEFATEMIAAFAGSGLPMTQVPIRFCCDKRQGASHLRTVRDGLRHLYYIMK